MSPNCAEARLTQRQMDPKISKQCNLQFTKSCENSEQTSHILMILSQNLLKYYSDINAFTVFSEILIIIGIFRLRKRKLPQKCHGQNPFHSTIVELLSKLRLVLFSPDKQSITAQIFFEIEHVYLGIIKLIDATNNPFLRKWLGFR